MRREQKDLSNLKENVGLRTNGNRLTTELEMRFLLRGMKFWNSLPGGGLSSKNCFKDGVSAVSERGCMARLLLIAGEGRG